MLPTFSTGTIEPLIEHLKNHGQTPEAYLLLIFKSRDVVLLAEEHAIRHNPDPDWHRRPQTLSEYWQQIRAYVDIQQRMASLEPPPWLAGAKR